ncbi:MAG: glycogen synthase GlgA [Deltaproteobacteria bacterium]|nr:glycogen synthase GlgA [Deltaproteobacteria bacterium]
MRILYASPEVVPFSKTGGLADVAGSLPVEIARAGHQVVVAAPLHQTVDRAGSGVAASGKTALVPVAGRMEPAEIFEAPLAGAPAGSYVVLIGSPRYFDRKGIYGDAGGDYPDNAERFAFFSRAVLEAAKAVGFRPDIVHGNDWQTGPAFPHLKRTYAFDPFFSGVRAVFTIHNIGYQGLFDPGTMETLMLPWELYHYQALEFWGKVSFLKAGIVFADAVTTVSPRYAREIRTEEFGCGLQGVLEEKRDRVFGFLNGADYTKWDPATDRLIAKNYSAANMSGKAGCKADLQAAFGLPVSDVPVIGMVSRLADHKGFGLIADAGAKIASLRCQLVVLGIGDRKYRDCLSALKDKRPDQVGLSLTFDDALAHKIEAGSDVFLMPSRYEPCGLNQMYSLRYGTIPIVHAVGGLDDAVEDYDPKTGNGTGFKFGEYAPDALIGAVKRALNVYRNKTAWEALVKRAMACDFSWTASARKYVELYERLHKA